jgi:deoxyadenosine/deoxycytidine kinase
MTEIRIAVIGAPGSGKSAFAQKLATEIRAARGETKKKTPVRVVDGYMDKLQKKTGYAFDIFATVPQNLQVLFHRWTLEQEAEKAGCDVLITAGSLYETILYGAMRINSDAVLYPKDKNIQVHGRVGMEAFGMIHSMIAVQDLLFYLPYTEKQVAEKGRSYDVAINDKLPEVVDGYFRVLNVLEGTTKRKLADALRAVGAVERWKAENPSPSDEPPV